MDFFISRAGADNRVAIWIAQELRVMGYTTLLQDDDFRPGQSIAANMVIGGRCERTIALLSPDYFQSDFTAAEWEAAFVRDPSGRERRLIPILVRPCEIAPTVRRLAYITFVKKSLDQRRKALRDCVRDISPLTTERGQSQRQHVVVAKLPDIGPLLIGREKELRRLDDAWSSREFRLVSIVAPGGVGKSALAAHWWRQNRAHDATRVLFESFYSQGTREDAQASADPFMDRALRTWFKIEVPPKHSWEKGEQLAEMIRRERILLILDGLEPLQQPDGRMKEPGMTALIKELAADNPGLCICTSRQQLKDLEIFGQDGVLAIDLSNLTPQAGAAYLRELGVDGVEDERRQISREFGNHALALTLLGQYLVGACNGDIRRLDTIPSLFAESSKGGHARRIMRQYEALFKDKPELAILRMLGLFDRPADVGALRMLRRLEFFGLNESNWNSAVGRLRNARLIEGPSTDESLDCHPLVREHFAEEFSTSDFDAFRQAHSALYEHYMCQSPYRPDALAEMTPLFYSAYHGCKAERHLEVRDKICFERVLRRDEAFILKTLGAFGAYLSLLANFFQSRWAEPLAALSTPDRIWVMGEAAFCLRGLGRLSEALNLMESAAKLSEDLHDWKTSAIRYRNLIRLYLLLGDSAKAIECGCKCIELADRSCDPFQALSGRAALAYAYNLRGSLDEAEHLFLEAEKRQTDHQPARPLLYSVLGYFYCDFLLDRGSYNEVIRRASVTIDIALKERWTLQTALDHLSLGRAKALSAAETSKHLNEAVRGLRLSGQVDYLPSGLLARATNLRQTGEFVAAQRDLDEVRVLATRCGMRLYLLDYHLEQARLLMVRSQSKRAQPLITQAWRLIAETGYHRREPELKALEAEIATPKPPKPLVSD